MKRKRGFLSIPKLSMMLQQNWALNTSNILPVCLSKRLDKLQMSFGVRWIKAVLLQVVVYCWCYITQLTGIPSARAVGCVLAFLALCKVGFVSGLCAPCNVLKIAWGSFGKVSGCVKLVRCVQQGDVQRTGLAEVRELVFHRPGTDDDWKTYVEDNNKKLNKYSSDRYEAQ